MRTSARNHLLAAGILASSFIAVPAAAQRRGGSEKSPAASAAPEAVHAVEVTMAVGDSKSLTVGDVANYHVASDGIVEVHFNGDTVVFDGKHAGSTSVVLIKRNGFEVTYIVNVFLRDPKAVEAELTELLEGYTGVRPRRVGARFFIEGGVSTEADAKRISLIASLYPSQVESLVVVGSSGADRGVNVRLDFYFVQYDRSSSYGIGVTYPSQFGAGTYNLAVNNPLQHSSFNAAGAVTNPGATLTSSASFSQTLPALDLAETHGWAKVLKHSTVVTTSGSEATFKSGGEQNFQIATAQATGIHPIPFGTNVTVTPRYDLRSRDLDVKIGADVADLTPPEGATTLPGRTTTTISTFVHVKLGQAIVLSGIRSRSQTHSVAGLPGLDWIPILGVLFASHTNSIQETEGAVFVIPSVVEAISKRSFDMVDAAMRHYDDFGSSLNGGSDLDDVHSFSHDPPSYVK
jgi:pilus assembly protein CpaC